MGNACAGGAKMDDQAKKIEQDLKDDRKRANEEMKILLLGAGESGKSTIAKQFRIINKGDYTAEELKDYKGYLLDNTMASIKALVNAADKLGIQIDKDAQPAAQRIREVDNLKEQIKTISSETSEDIRTLWKDSGIQETFKRANEYQLNDNARYCLENIDRISAADFTPTQQDAIHCRVRTTGVIETHFEMGKRKVRLVDVGGQRAERRKWMGCFEDVTAVIFCLALSEYDLKLAEDEKTNRMHESIRIFEELTGRWFPRTTIVLFLNKADIFKEKITRVSLKEHCFSEYNGENAFEPASKYIEQKFLGLDKCEQQRIYPHITTATDTENVKKVFDAVKDTLVQGNLSDIGI